MDASEDQAAPEPEPKAAPREANEPALLEAENVRIDRDGVPELENLSFTSTAMASERAVVLGAPRSFFEACAGIERAKSGELRICGTVADEAARAGKTAASPASMRFPEKWTLLDLATWSARLGGVSKSRAEIGAHQALSSLDLRGDSRVVLAKAPVHVRALAPLVAALATQAPVLLFEDPTTQLPSDLARALAKRVVTALEGTTWILFTGHIGLSSPFALHAEEAIVIGGGKVSQGAVAEVAAREGTYAVRIHGEARTFAKLVTSKGGTSKGDGDELLIDLGEKLRTRDLFDLADEAHSVIVELRPLSRAFV
ncbi:MAG: hypothetical protein ACRELY_21785 [Polyangiaceae bacterium]